MSKFTTTIPVLVDEALAKLPAGAFVHPVSGVNISPDKRSLVIEWEHDDFKTPYSRPVEMSLAVLEGSEAAPDTIKVPAEFKKVQRNSIEPKSRKATK